MSKPTNIESWPVVWRVVAPGCGSYGRDMVFFEGQSEKEARHKFHALRCGQYPVRLERVQCGSLPADADASLQSLFEGNAGAGQLMPEIAGRWREAH